MKTEDFEWLKAICVKEGFTIESYSGGKTAIIGVKDKWEGVEFVQEKDTLKIYKVGHFHNSQVWVFSDVEWIWKDNCKPSTEQAYIEQLKKEFDFKGIRKFKMSEVDISMMDGGCIKDPVPEFVYRKDIDTMYFHGVPVYQKGKWAKKLPKKVEVSFIKSTGFSDVKFEDGRQNSGN